MSQPITINFLVNKTYPELKRKGLEVGSSLGHDLSVKYGKVVTNLIPKTVNGLGPCVGVTIFSPNRKFVAHSAPELENPCFVKDFISKKIYELKTKDKCKNEDISAVIYGGIAYDEANPLSNDSCRLVDAIEEGCNLESINPTIITGQYSNGLSTRIDSYIGLNQITMWGKLIDKIKLSHNATQGQIQNVLKEFFEYIKIPQNTKLNIMEELPCRTEHLLNKQV